MLAFHEHGTHPVFIVNQVCKVPLPGDAAALRGIKRSADDDAVISVEVKDPTLQKRIGKLLRVKDHSSWRMRYHAFVSHAQLEASGEKHH